MALDSMVVILLPIILFIITIIVIFILRESDNRRRGLTNVRRLTDQYRAELDKKSNSFRVEVEELQNQIDEKKSKIQDLLKTVEDQMSELDKYSDDMANLKFSMGTYREALSGLAKLTTDSDEKINQIEADILRLSEVQNTIDAFKMDMKDADEHLKQHESSVIKLQGDTVANLEETISNFKAEAEKVVEDARFSFQGFSDALIQNRNETKAAAEALHASGMELLNSIGDRNLEQKALSEQIVELERTRDGLEKTIAAINSQVGEKRNFASELENLAREESERISSLRENLEWMEKQRIEAEKALEVAREREKNAIIEAEKIESRIKAANEIKEDSQTLDSKTEDQSEEKQEDEESELESEFDTDKLDEIIIEESPEEIQTEDSSDEEIIFN